MNKYITPEIESSDEEEDQELELNSKPSKIKII